MFKLSTRDEYIGQVDHIEIDGDCPGGCQSDACNPPVLCPAPDEASSCTYYITLIDAEGGVLSDEQVTFVNRIPDSTTYTYAELLDIIECAFSDTDPQRREETALALFKYHDQFEINTDLRLAHFLGQIGYESNELTELQEQRGYSSKETINRGLVINTIYTTVNGESYYRYCALFEGYELENDCECYRDSLTNYRNSPGLCDPLLPDTADYDSLVVKNSFLRRAGRDNLYDYIYSCNRGAGNGAPCTGDGSTFAGKGFIQLTGKAVYKEISDAWNADCIGPDSLDCVKNFHIQTADGGHIDLLTSDIDIAMKASLYYWDEKNVNDQISGSTITEEQMRAVTRRVKGSDDTWQDRRNIAIKVLNYINTRECN